MFEGDKCRLMRKRGGETYQKASSSEVPVSKDTIIPIYYIGQDE